MWKKYFKQLSLPESYISITLGFLVVIVGGLLLYNYFNKNKQGESSVKEVVSEEKAKEEKVGLPTTHTISEGETLWSIALKYYNSGYNWVTLAKENNLANSDVIAVGSVLNIPQAETIKPVEGVTSSTAVEPVKQYTVVKGDNLWNISVAQYGDGFAWTNIAKSNNLVNPNLIHPGNVLTLPR